MMLEVSSATLDASSVTGGPGTWKLLSWGLCCSGLMREGPAGSRELSEALGEREEQVGELVARVAEVDADRERLWAEAQRGLALSSELAGMTRQFQASA